MVIAGGVARGDRNALRAYFKTGYNPYQLSASNKPVEWQFERAIGINFLEPNTAVELLLESGFNINETYTRHGTALLHEAILNLNGAEALEAVRFLIARGANTNIRDRYGETPLHLATWQEDEEVMEFLVTQGANVNAQDSNGWTALHHLLFPSRLPPSPVANGSTSSPASQAIASFLIAQGADVNPVDIRGNTVLHFSALSVSSWERPIMKLLIAAGANVNAVDATGRTALHLVATSCKDPDSINSNSHYGNFARIWLRLLRIFAIDLLEKPMLSFKIS
jgi:ankyrin repeat protein